MKYFVAIVLTALLSLVAGLYLPWWSIAVTAFLVSVIIPQKPLYAFFSGFIGVFLLWEILAWWRDTRNDGILSQKIAQVLPLGGSTLLLILITSLIGAIVAGFAALAASYLRKPE
ncbi:MAG: hypothetical protein C5B59_02830 [Bacteroidetes bacterium]|nr:MAG: hypothetical protein C5B59_02830 [Bacteroidota bacterium]